MAPPPTEFDADVGGANYLKDMARKLHANGRESNKPYDFMFLFCCCGLANTVAA